MQDDIQNPIDVEAQLFIEDVSEALQFATEILSQLPATDSRRDRLSQQLNSQVSDLISQHSNDAGAMFDPETIENESLQQAAALLVGDGSCIEQMRVLRGYYGGRVWSSVIAVLSCLLEDEQKYELSALSNYNQFTAFYNTYNSNLDKCKQAHAHNLVQAQNEFALQTQLLSKATQMNRELNDFQVTKKQMGAEMDTVAVDTSKRCDELLEDIQKLKQVVSEKQAEATQAAFKCKIFVQPKVTNKKLITLQLVINQINEIYTHKQKTDLQLIKNKKQTDSLRTHLFTFFGHKFGQNYSKSSNQIKSFIYSVGYYSNSNSVCAVFNSELNLEIDEAFKMNILKLERKIDQLKLVNAEEIIDQLYNEENIKQVLLQHITNTQDVNQIKNAINLFELNRHKLVLNKFKQVYVKFDTSKTGRISVKQFINLCEELRIEPTADIVQQASKQSQFVNFTNCVLTLGFWIFQEEEGQKQEVEQEVKREQKQEKPNVLQYQDL
ncbi:Conserved_hypothetical protein [Hexamita inflata]|uniref:EF-hand domain-containing protein n=1 Tax=Hexamita inflata TaxID=28002 RepID=A0AA86U977_9EUKA|nr:Conserved hypothetical protein [Hexamita inflata]